jgi:alkylhydroperoxidase family enzyme
MAQLLEEITWSEPILPAVADAAWEAEVKRRAMQVGEVDRRVVPNPWLRQLCLAVVTYRPAGVSQRLLQIGSMVTAQENSCRYCYGANRAFLKILGYSESFISRLERDTHIAELDEKERGFIAFCRNLARSRPRPARADRERLVGLGYAPREVNEIAFVIAMYCFYNRIGILTASPPERSFERMANGLLGRVMGPVIRWQMGRRQGGGPQAAQRDAATLAQGAFGPVVATLAGLPAAAVMRDALDGAFASPVLSRPAKALMFAVVARTLGCRHSEAASRALLETDGFAAAEIDAALATLDCARLPPQESRLLSWARDTVYYQTPAIQAATRTLVAETGNAAALEAIGIAALANATVRMAMLLE